MDQFYLIVIAVLIVAVLLLVFVLKPDLAKKYWGYVAAGAAVVGGIVFALTQRKEPPASPDPEMQEKEEKLQEDLRAVHEEAEVEIQAAREKETAVNAEVEEIKQIEDREERLRRLSNLFNRTRRR